jgi:hypothetical protein
MDQEILSNRSRSHNTSGFRGWHLHCLAGNVHNIDEMAKRSANKSMVSLADEILEYFVNHERAHDSAEGILTWWLPVQRIEYAIKNVEVALRDLVARDLLIARKARDGRLHYRMNPKKKQDIRRRLEAKTEASPKVVGLPSMARKHHQLSDN